MKESKSGRKNSTERRERLILILRKNSTENSKVQSESGSTEVRKVQSESGSTEVRKVQSEGTRSFQYRRGAPFP